VIAIDTNLLVYAHRKDSKWHSKALRALEGLDAQSVPWAIPWPCVFEFYNIVTHPKIFTRPTPPERALDAINGWQESQWLKLISEGESAWSGFSEALSPLDITGPKIHDARIALICRYHGVDELWSADRDFSRFGFQKVRNPLV
jgi:hypothetical protein